MKIRTRMQAAVLSILAIAITAAAVIFLGGDKYNTPNRHPIVQLEEGWTVHRGDSTYSVDKLSTTSFDMMNKYASEFKGIDELLLDEFERLFVCLYTTNVNATW